MYAGSKKVCINFVIEIDIAGERFPVSRRLRCKKESRIFQRINGHWLSQFAGVLPQKFRRLLPFEGGKVRRQIQSVKEKDDGK